MKRLQPQDVSTLQERLDASLEIDRGETYQAAIERLEPKLSALRSKGASYRELAKLLSDAGMAISPVTLRVYLGRAIVRNKRKQLKREGPLATERKTDGGSRKGSGGTRGLAVAVQRVAEQERQPAAADSEALPVSAGSFRVRADSEVI